MARFHSQGKEARPPWRLGHANRVLLGVPDAWGPNVLGSQSLETMYFWPCSCWNSRAEHLRFYCMDQNDVKQQVALHDMRS